jgi:hypothetical protein
MWMALALLQACAAPPAPPDGPPPSPARVPFVLWSRGETLAALSDGTFFQADPTTRGWIDLGKHPELLAYLWDEVDSVTSPGECLLLKSPISIDGPVADLVFGVLRGPGVRTGLER